MDAAGRTAAEARARQIEFPQQTHGAGRHRSTHVRQTQVPRPDHGGTVPVDQGLLQQPLGDPVAARDLQEGLSFRRMSIPVRLSAPKMGFEEHVDPVQCEYGDYTFCNRATAVAAMGATSAFLGALVGSLIKTDVWTPVALDALGPPRARGARTGLGLRAVPGGLGAQLSVSF